MNQEGKIHANDGGPNLSSLGIMDGRVGLFIEFSVIIGMNQ